MLTNLNDVWAFFAQAIQPLDNELLHVEDSLGRVLSQDILAKRPHPHHDIAAMDGYGFAAQAQDQTLELVGVAAAGEPFNGIVQAGQAVRILTGADIPAGANCVAMQEDCKVQGDIVAVPATTAGTFMRFKGADFNLDSPICVVGQKISSQAIAVLLAAGYATIPVYRQSTWHLLATGSELSVAGSNHGTINSNIPALKALLQQNGGLVSATDQAVDDQDSLMEKISAGLGCDVLLMTGGVSVGDKDLVRPCLEAFGAKIHFHGLMMKPGKPSLLANIGKTWILALPGNPVSAQVCGQLLALPMLRRFQGQTAAPKFHKAKILTDLPKGIRRENYLRGYVKPDDQGQHCLELMQNQDSAALYALSQSNCLVPIGINAEAKSAGHIVDVLMIENAKI